jgi:hypothetical protein
MRVRAQNYGAGGRGCDHSLASGGALLSASDNASMANDTLTLLGSDMPNGAVIDFQGSTYTNVLLGSAFGDGLRCAGGTIVRPGTKLDSGGVS